MSAKITRLLLIPFLLLTGAAILPQTTRADEFHYTNQVIGDRAAGLGGAYTAISDDPSGLYYNPAGIVYAQAGNLTASVNAFSAGEKTYKSVLGGRQDWVRESYSLLPNFFGIIQNVGKGMIGLSYAMPDSIIEDQDQQFLDDFPSSLPGIDVDIYTININKKDNTYKFGPSVAMQIVPDLSVGFTLYFHYREKDFIKNEYVMLDTQTSGNTYKDFEWTNYYYESFEYGYEPILGIMWSPIKKLSLGLRLSQTQIISSETTAQSTSRSEIQGTVTHGSPIIVNNDDKRKHPTNVRLGATWFAGETLLVTTDLSYFSSTSDSFFGDKKEVWDMAAGVEWYLTPTAALRLGAFTQNANTPEVTAGVQNQEEHINLYGGSASISKFTRNSSITLGGTLAMGDGEAQVFADNSTVQDVEAWNYTIYLSTSYSF